MRCCSVPKLFDSGKKHPFTRHLSHLSFNFYAPLAQFPCFFYYIYKQYRRRYYSVFLKRNLSIVKGMTARKILAVDDNLINIELLGHIVRKYYPEFEFITALSGEEGIKRAKDTLPDLILLDIMMPGLDGYETCSLLKSNETTKHIPIIMVSALGHDSAERSKGLNAGADSFLSKPFDQVELSAQINVALRIKNYQERLRKLNSELTLVEERERRRIAENLHDSLGPNFTCTGICSGSALETGAV